MGLRWISHPSSSITLLFLLVLLPTHINAAPAPDFDYGAHPRFICTPIPVDADPSCPTGAPVVGLPPGVASGPGPYAGLPSVGTTGELWGLPEEAKTTFLHLRESLVQQKETILDQRETIRELTAKLALCEGLGRTHSSHHSSPAHHGGLGSHQTGSDDGHHGNGNSVLDTPHYFSMGGGTNSVGGLRPGGGGSHGQRKEKGKHGPVGALTPPEEMGRMLEALKKRMDNLQSRNSSTTYSRSLKDLLQRKINTLEQQMHHHSNAALHSTDQHHDDDSSHHDNGTHHGDDHHDEADHSDGHAHHDNDDSHHEDTGHSDNPDETDSPSLLAQTGGHAPHAPRNGLRSTKLESVLNHLHRPGPRGKKGKSSDAFQIGFPMRTNYMYGRVKRTLLHEIFGFTLCLWIKAEPGPGLGTPFSYSVPGQANEIVLIEWANNPMELLVDDQAVSLPLSVNDGKWHHVAVTWSTRDGVWEAYQDGVKRGSGENLSSWHPIRPGGVFILGQEQDTLGGRFDATQSFVGEMSDLQMWSQVLSANDIHSLASCGNHLGGDIFTWSDTAVELHGGVTKYPFDPCL